jgi:hypothetical protein
MCEEGSGAFHIPKCLQEGGVNKMPIVSSSTSSKEGAFTFGELSPPFKVLRKPKMCSLDCLPDLENNNY